jgi:phage head maturation protease
MDFQLTQRELAAFRGGLTPLQARGVATARGRRGAPLNLGMQTRIAALTPSTLNRQARTVDVVWSTGAAVKTVDDRGYVVMQSLSMEPSAVRMGRLTNGASVLNSHQAYDLANVIGVVERAAIRNGEGVATVRFHDDSAQVNPVVEPIWAKIAAGIIRQVSVGYIVHRWQDTTPAGATMRSALAVDWEPCEISIVPVAADAGAGIRSARSMARSSECTPSGRASVEHEAWLMRLRLAMLLS